MTRCPSGIITALPTPFVGGRPDLRTFSEFVEWQVHEGCRCLAVGTVTGEAPTLTPAEQHDLLRTCIDAAGGRVPVFASIVGSSTARCVSAAIDARDAGADGILIATPAYNKPTQHGLVRHFAAVGDATDLPLVIHNAPGRSVVDLKTETVSELLSVGTIVGLVDGSGDPGRIAALARATCGRLDLFGGSDAGALAANLDGASGHLSIVANIAPRLCSLFQIACELGDWARAAQIQRQLQPLAHALDREPDPAPIKYALSRRHVGFGAGLRLPMVPVSSTTAQAISAAMDGIAGLERPDGPFLALEPA